MLIYQLLLLFCFNFHLQRTSDQVIRFSNTALSHTENEHTKSLIVRHNTKWKFTTKNKSLFSPQFPAILLPRSEQMPIWHNSYYRVLHSNHLFQASRSKHFHLVTVFLLRVMSILTLNRIFMSISDLHGPINTFDKIWLLGLQISKSCLGIHQQSLRRLLCLVVFLFADHYSLKIVSTNFSVTEIVFCCEFCNANYFL